MSSSIDFYLLPYPPAEAFGVYTCRLTEKIYKQQHQIFIYTNSSSEAQKLNDLLWSFRDISFIPHDIYTSNTSSAPIKIGYPEEPPPEPHDILINLTPTVPVFYNQFNRILEIIPNDATLKAAGREKYKYYQQQNAKLATHNIS